MDQEEIKLELMKFYPELNHCMHCHLCYAADWHRIDDWVPVCPTAARFGFEAFYSSGRIELGRALIEETLQEASPRFLDILYTCTGCSACVEQCHEYSGVKIDQVDLFETMKAFCVSKGWGPLPKHLEFAQSIAKDHNPYHESPKDRSAWLSYELPSEAPIVYFVGCTSSYRRQEIAQATVKVLKASGIPFTILGSEEWCCGSPLIRTGQLDQVQELISHNIEVLEGLGAERVIFSCAGCYRAFKKDYPKFGFSPPFKIEHTTQFFLNLIRNKKLNLNPLSKVVTYHDPCHLGRHTRIYKQPRKVMKKLQVDLQEMPRTLKESFCCGAGGGVRAAYPEFAKWAATNRLNEALELNPMVLASACPFCKNNFIEAFQDFKGVSLEISDISELLAEGLNE
ncbi:MAG: (Fe-S)-binding protein [Candidatus Helarchaeota archaeon]|nr:(Fe-S)-binding protein [Candidatus Helarchaeota archaeon]